MISWAGSAGLALAGALWLLHPGAPAARLLTLDATTSESLATRRSHRPVGQRLASPTGRRLAALAAGAAVVVMAPGGWGLVGGCVIAAVLDRWLSALPDRASAALVDQTRRQLPLALELMAAALAAGAPVERALLLAARGTGPPLSLPLLEVAASVRLGAGADEAWRGAGHNSVLRPLARLAVRSEASGAAMAQACRDLASRERQASVAGAEAAIRRAGVLAVLPLGLCFLPAFVLVGVVPLVVGLLGSLAL